MKLYADSVNPRRSKPKHDGNDLRSLHSSGNTTVRSVQCSGDFRLTGGSLTVTSGASQVNGPFTITKDGSLTTSGANTAFTALGQTVIDGASLNVSGGAVLSLPGLRNYVTGSSCGNTYWEASGADSVLDLSGLTNLVGGSCGTLHIQALIGGKVLLTNLTTIPDSMVSVLAGGTDSAVDLSGLTSYRGKNYSISLEARAGGLILIPNATTLDRVTLIFRNTGTISTAQLRSLTRANVTIDGTTVPFPNLIDTTGTTFTYQNGGRVTPLPPSIAPLVLNQLVTSRLLFPFSADQWFFSAVAGQPVLFDLVNITRAGVQFTLTGPNGWSGFSNQTNDFGPVTLPASGGYTLTAATTGFPADYGFRLVDLVPIDLALGATYNGRFSGNGQVQIFRIAPANGGPMSIVLRNPGANNVPVVMTLTGAGFDRSTTVSLVSTGDVAYPSARVEADFFRQLTVTFAANTVPPGLYSVRAATGDGQSTTLTNTLVMEGAGQPKLETKLVLPNGFGRHATATIYVEYANRGNAAMPAPLLVLHGSDNALLTLDAQRLAQGFWTSARPAGFSDTVQFLARGAGRLSRKDNGNGTDTTHDYSLAGQLLPLINSGPTGTVISRFDYTYDSLGRRTSMNTIDGQWTYEYDATGQLIHAVLDSTNSAIPDQDLTCVYDALGNRIRNVENGVTSAYTANNLNEYTRVGTAVLTYDVDGNLIRKVDGAEVTTYGYDAENRLVGVVKSTRKLVMQIRCLRTPCDHIARWSKN